MKKFSKLKIGIGLAYLSIVTGVVVLFFYYGANSFLDLEFLKNNKEEYSILETKTLFYCQLSIF